MTRKKDGLVPANGSRGLARREATAALLVLGLASFSATAQPARRTYRIGFLGVSTPSDYAQHVEAFKQGLRELGYEAGKNIAIEYRWAEGREDRLPELAAQLVRLEPDLIVTHATGIRAVQLATSTIPIVMGASADPVALGLIKSLASPGGNTTGVASLIVDLASKRLQLLKEVIPKLESVAVLSHSSNPGLQRGLAATESAARKLGVRVRPHWVEPTPNGLEAAFAAILRERPDGLIVQPWSYSAEHGVRITSFALKNGLPAMGSGRRFAVDGGLIAYGADFVNGWRVAAQYVDKILKGAKPADLPVQQPTTFELIINLKTAKALRLTLSPSLLVRANEVIQ